MAAAVQTPLTSGTIAEAGHPYTIQSLPFDLDFSCPISLPSKSVSGTSWPFEISGSAEKENETAVTFLHRRYLETIFLSDLLSSFSSFVLDLQRIDPGQLAHPISLLLKTVTELENRHRKVISPLVSALVTIPSSGYAPEVKRSLLDESVSAANLATPELGGIKTAIELRLNSRRSEEGGETSQTKKLSEEFERREAFLQLILLFTYIGLNSDPKSESKKRSKKRRRHEFSTALSPTEDPTSTLEMFMDRLSIWAAVADLGLDLELEAPGAKIRPKPHEEDGMQAMLRRFWEEVMVPFFLPKQADLCSMFHLKIFAQPIPSSLLPKKAKLPRSESYLSQRNSTTVRSTSKAPSESGSRASLPPETDHQRRRSLSRSESTIQGQSHSRRSRSRSIDPVNKDPLADLATKRPLVRAPSGKELFKSREVQLMRRTTSLIRKESQKILDKEITGEGQSQITGLLGRKTSDPIRNKRRTSNDETQAHAQNRESQKPGTLILATPSRPRYGNPFGPRAIHHPTPIQEEPRSRERPSFIAETPIANRIGGIPSSARVFGFDAVEEDNDGIAEDGSDTLADLMVMTDEEEDDHFHDHDQDQDHVADRGFRRTGTFVGVPKKPAR